MLGMVCCGLALPPPLCAAMARNIRLAPQLIDAHFGKMNENSVLGFWWIMRGVTYWLRFLSLSLVGRTHVSVD